jgi:general stress protein 26
MMDTAVLTRILDVLRTCDFICLATTDGVSPRARYISLRGVDDDLTLTCATGMTDRKTAHIRKNPRVHVIAGFPPQKPDMPNVSIDAVATIHTDHANRARYWEDSFRAFFSGVDDENYVVLKLHPTRAWISTGQEIVDFPAFACV